MTASKTSGLTVTVSARVVDDPSSMVTYVTVSLGDDLQTRTKLQCL